MKIVSHKRHIILVSRENNRFAIGLLRNVTKYVRCLVVYLLLSDSVTRVNDSTTLESRFLVTWDTTRISLRKTVTRHKSRFSQNDSSHSK